MEISMGSRLRNPGVPVTGDAAHARADRERSRRVRDVARARRAGAPLAHMTAECARRWPKLTALHDASGSVSFRELHRATERLARLLVALGVEKGDRVAILGTKDIPTVVAILAAARAGAVYVPVDPNMPEARLSFVLEDAAPRLVMGRARLYALSAGRAFVETDHVCEAESPLARTAVAGVELPEVRPEDLAYMMYTSGSTGYPKGVLIEHGAVAAFFRAHNARAEIGPGDRCMNTGPFHFDVSIMDVFLPLCFGASVILTPELPMPKLLLHTIERHRVTHFYAVGTILALMTGDGRWLDHYDLSSLRMLQTGAEVCSARVVNEWLTRLPELGFLNSYGPTEVTVGCVCYRKPEPGPLREQDVPIGSVHEGSRVLLLDTDGTLREPSSAEGELLVAGEQVMRGYHRRAQEESAAFVLVDGVRYYRTGDIVRCDARGVLHYVGRRDDEVKVDGVRIHLSEVKRCLDQHGLIANSAVLTLHNRQERLRVAAAIVPRRALGPQDVSHLLADLARELPQPALPFALLVCEDFPRMATGKTDARTLKGALSRAVTRHVARAFVLSGSEAVPLERLPVRQPEDAS